MFIKNLAFCALAICVTSCAQLSYRENLHYSVTPIHERCCGRYVVYDVRAYEPNRFYYLRSDNYHPPVRENRYFFQNLWNLY